MNCVLIIHSFILYGKGVLNMPIIKGKDSLIYTGKDAQILKLEQELSKFNKRKPKTKEQIQKEKQKWLKGYFRRMRKLNREEIKMRAKELKNLK